MSERYPLDKKWWNIIIYTSFFLGVNATDNPANYNFGYQCSGFLVILLLSILERKAQLWLKDKFKLDEALNHVPLRPMWASRFSPFTIIEEESEDQSNSSFSKVEHDEKVSDKYRLLLKQKSDHSMKSSKEERKIQKSFSLNKPKNELKIQLNLPDYTEDHKSYDDHEDNCEMRTSKMKRLNSVDRETYKIADDLYFKNQVFNMLKLKYKFGFMKGFSALIGSVILLMLMFMIVSNANVISLILFLSLIFLSVKSFSYNSLIYVNLIIIVTLILQY
jgi:hypothetical protein